MSSSQEDHQRHDVVAPRVLVLLLTMIGGAAIAVGMLLPVLLITQQSNNLAIARLEAEVAQMRSALGSAPTPSPRPVAASSETPAPSAAPAASTDTPPRAAPRPAPVRPDTSRPTGARAEAGPPTVTERAPAATPAAPPEAKPEPATPLAAAVSADPPPTSSPPVLTDVEVRVEYAGRCLDVAMDVAKRLNNLGAAPDMVQRDSANAVVGRLTYARAEQVGAATRLAERLGDIVPVEVAFDSTRAADPIRLRLSNDADCGRAGRR